MRTRHETARSTGDSHNFHRRVFTHQTGQGLIVEKPRSIYWEWLFFGANSPLREALSGSSSQPFDSLFGLQVREMRSKGGTVVFVKKQLSGGDQALRHRLIEEYGKLLAYCFFFGIEDLHHENVIPTYGRWQVVDVESVFSDLSLPNETLLLPLGSVSWIETPIGRLGSWEEIRTLGIAKTMIGSFVRCMHELQSAIPRIRSMMIERREQIHSTPIRLMLRSTREYTGRLPLSATLLPEEETQLSRGDIPYFFKFLGAPEIYWYVNEQLDFEPIEQATWVTEKSENRATPLDWLFTEERFETKLFPQGLCYLANELLPVHWGGTVSIEDLKIETSPTHLRISGPAHEFDSERATM